MQKLVFIICALLLPLSACGPSFSSEAERCEYLVGRQAEKYSQNGGFELDGFSFRENEITGKNQAGETIQENLCLMRYTQDGSVKIVSLKIIENIFKDPPQVLAKFNALGIDEENEAHKKNYIDLLQKYFGENYQNGY